MPLCIVTYDVPSDSLRTQIAHKLQDYGLDRLQFSVFHGFLTRNRAEELALELRELIGEDEADVRIFFLCEKCLRKTIIVKERYPLEAVEAVIT